MHSFKTITAIFITGFFLFSWQALHAQGQGNFPSTDAHIHQSPVSFTPADSSGISGGKHPVKAEIVMQDTTGIDEVHVTLEPSQGQAPVPLANKTIDVDQARIWRKGTKTDFKGYAIYVDMGHFQPGMNKQLAVQLEDPQGNQSQVINGQ